MYAQSNQGKYLYISTLKSVSLFAEKKSFKLIHGKTSVIPTREKGKRNELKTNTLFIRSFNKKVKKKTDKTTARKSLQNAMSILSSNASCCVCLILLLMGYKVRTLGALRAYVDPYKSSDPIFSNGKLFSYTDA